MSHGPEHHLEEAEQAQHAVHNPFDRRVAMTIAIVAAALACVTMLGHREHNDTLRLQTEADIHHTQAADKWAEFQANNIRDHAYQANLELLRVIPKDRSSAAARQEVENNWQQKVGEYGKKLPGLKKEAEDFVEEAKRLQKESEEAHHRATRFDLGELGVELALVLCSIAVLTKRAPFWYSGIGIGAVGFVVALTGFLLH